MTSQKTFDINPLPLMRFHSLLMILKTESFTINSLPYAHDINNECPLPSFNWDCIMLFFYFSPIVKFNNVKKQNTVLLTFKLNTII